MHRIESRVIRLEYRLQPRSDIEMMRDAELLAEIRDLDPDEATFIERMRAGDCTAEELAAFARSVDLHA